MCDAAMGQILTVRHGDRDRAITDDDLSVLLESLGVELDLFADLFHEKEWRQGYTEFFLDRPPIVRIARGLAENNKYANRFRFTLAHETGHILAQREAYERIGNVCSRGSAWLSYCNKHGLRRQLHDWLEFQADYCGGALLMPKRLLDAHISLHPELNASGRNPIYSTIGRSLAVNVSERFHTSVDAARVRLISLGYLFRPSPGTQLRLGLEPENGEHDSTTYS